MQKDRRKKNREKTEWAKNEEGEKTKNEEKDAGIVLRWDSSSSATSKRENHFFSFFCLVLIIFILLSRCISGPRLWHGGTCQIVPDVLNAFARDNESLGDDYVALSPTLYTHSASLSKDRVIFYYARTEADNVNNIEDWISQAQDMW